MNRIVFCLVLVALVIGNFWLVRSLYDLLFRPQYVIAPFRITGDKAAEAKLGESFASMLQGRLVQILRDLENSQRFLREKPSPEETEDPAGSAAGAPPSVRTTLGDPEPVRQLTLVLLDRYQCDWTREDLLAKVLAINQELKLMPDQLIREAFAAEGLGARPAPR